jgi:hypothetical protein
VRNKDWQEFLVPVNQLWDRWSGQQMVVGSTNEAETSSNPVSPLEELEPKTLTVEKDKVNPRMFKPGIAIGGWTIFWLVLTAIVSTTSVAGYWLLTSLPPTADCRNNSLLGSDGEKLYCAQKQAESGKLKDLQAAMAIAINISQDRPLYNESQRSIGEWSLDLLRIAQDKVDKGDLKGARAIVKQIPTNSVNYKKVQAKVARWQTQWQNGAEIEKKFYTAIKAQRWQTARSEVDNLYFSNSEYWRFKMRERLLNQLVAEKEGWAFLKEARRNAKNTDLPDILASIALTNKIKPKSHAKTLAKSDRDRWSQIVLKAVAAKYGRQDFAGAIALAKRVPQDVSVAKVATDWIALSQASQKAESKKDGDLLKALSALRQISPESPLYKQAQAKIAVWKQQLQSYTKPDLA